MPFGEYIPWHSALGWTQRYRHGLGTFSSGNRVHAFDVNGTLVGTPICFENTFPGLFRQFVAGGAQLMVVTTNDSSYLDSPASREHVIMSQLRAVETGRWVVQAAVSGESAIVNAHGQVVSRTGLFEQTILRGGRAHRDRADAVRAVRGLVPGRVRGDHARAARPGDRPPGPCPSSAALPRPAEPGADPPAGEGMAPAHAPIAGGAEPRVLVVLPTYNERATIEAAVRGVLKAGPSVHALIVDDGSPDGTGRIADDLAASEPRIRVLHREGKRGLSSAYLAGFQRRPRRGATTSSSRWTPTCPTGPRTSRA